MASVIKGIHKGTLTLRDATVEIKGIVSGDVRVHGRSDVLLSGMVSGNVSLYGGQMRLRGMVRGDVLNDGGTLTVRGIVSGRLETRSGETILEDHSLT